ncbi:MAG TPA: GNAT family N-acetyltransferase [Drouetiella sp.]
MTSALSVRWVGSQSDIPTELWEQCFAPPLEGRWWYEALEQSDLSDQFTFAYAILVQDGRDVGIAPTFLMDVPIEMVAPPEVVPILKVVGKIAPSMLYQRTLFIGSVCSDEGTIGLLNSIDMDSAAPVLQEAFEQKAKQVKAPFIVWKDFPEAYRHAMSNLLASHKMFELVSFPGTVLDLKHRSKEAYLAGLKGSRRHNLKKKLKKSTQKIELVSTVQNRPDAATLDECFALFWQTYKKGKTKFEKLNRKYFSEIADNDQSHFVILREKSNNKMVAFMLCFDIGPRVINKFIGIDYALPNDWFLYFRLWDAAIDWVLKSTNAIEFQSGQTGYRAKIDVGNSLVPLTNWCKHRNPIMHMLYTRATRDVTWSTLDDDLKVFLTAHPDESQEKAES